MNARLPVFPDSDRIDGWWSLLYHGWTLMAPGGARIDLTGMERACFLCLLGNPDRELL
ncbi:MAG TPA: transcriptional regulator, partial [Achromobacter sp.]|nr:transcriptional regulator [Achromobacter sp.]